MNYYKGLTLGFKLGWTIPLIKVHGTSSSSSKSSNQYKQEHVSCK